MVNLSEALLLAVKKGEDTQEIVNTLGQVSPDFLENSLYTDEQKKAFWINCYNAFFQILRVKFNLNKPDIFDRKVINLAGNLFSLDEIEHGILRRNKLKWSMGYLVNPFAPKILRKLSVTRLDYRIHFALNCGARSCPPIAFYQSERIDQQLEVATQSFLETEIMISDDGTEVFVSRLFYWFAGDFGGKSGIRDIIAEHLKLDVGGLKVKYKPYDWSEVLANFNE